MLELYDLPLERIAQRPAANRASRLLCATRDSNTLHLADQSFSDLPSLLRQGDLLVFNDSKVLPARFFAKLSSGAELELLLLSPLADAPKRNSSPSDSGANTEVWQALAKPRRKIKEGDVFFLAPNFSAQVLQLSEEDPSLRLLLSSVDLSIGEAIARHGLMPIPPYIRGGHADQRDRADYQTIFSSLAANQPDAARSVAAPTASLHFTEQILDALKLHGVKSCFLTHDLGPGSFLPIRGDLSDHKMSAERYLIPPETWALLKEQRQSEGRIIAVGTTVVRALESASAAGNEPGRWYQTELFIAPGYQFQLVDALITNFHQPRSTHLQLVAAYLGEEFTAWMYQHALQGDYRFLSYGDACFLQGGGRGLG